MKSIINFFKLFGLFTIFVCFIPTRGLFRDEKFFNSSYFTLPEHWITLILTNLVIIWLLSLIASRKNCLKAYKHIKEKFLILFRLKIIFCLLVITLCTLLALLAYKTNNFRPDLIDSATQMFQAKIFAAGHLTIEAPKHNAFFNTQHFLINDGKFSSQYPPGYSLLLALGFKLGVEKLVPLFFCLVGILFNIKLIKSVYDDHTAKIAFVLILICPFLLVIGSNPMNHSATYGFLSLFLYFLRKFELSNKFIFLYLASFALGFSFIIRPLCTVAVGFVAGMYFLKQIVVTKKYFLIVTAGLIFLGTISINFIYNYYSTGNALLSGYIKLWGEGHKLGFHISPWGHPHTPLEGLKNTIINFSILNEYCFEALFPGTIFFAIFWFVNKKPLKWDFIFFSIAFGITFAYFFYWHRDQFLGPRFLYTALLGFIPISARAIFLFYKYFGDKDIRIFATKKFIKIEVLFIIFLFLFVSSSAFYGFPRRVSIYSNSFKIWKQDLIKNVKNQNINKGLFFIPVSWGTRIISNLKEVGVSADLAEKSYYKIDHCLLDELSKRGLNKEISQQEIIKILKQRTALVSYKNKRLTLDKSKITDECLDELNYDVNSDYTAYAPFFYHNNYDLKGNYVFVQDLRERNELIKNEYKDYPVYFYINGKFEKVD